MKIIYLTNEWLGKEGGGVSHFKEISHALSDLGHKVYVLAPGYKREKLKGWNVPVYLVPMPGRNIFSFLLFEFFSCFILTIAIRNIKADVVLNRGTVFSAYLYKVCKFFKIRYVVEVNGIRDIESEHAGVFKCLRKIHDKMHKKVYRCADHFICVADGIREELIRRWPTFENKSTVINNGVNVEKFIPLEQLECRKKLDLPLEKFIIGFVGQLCAWHGIDDLLKATEILVSRGKINFLTLVVGGGERLPKLKELCKKEDIEEYTLFTGRVAHDQVPLYIGAFDIASQVHNDPIIGHMGDPLKFWEYLASGKALILSDMSSSKSHVQAGLIGWVFKGGDPLDLADKLEEIIDNRELCEQIGRANRQYIENGHRWKDVAKRVEEILRG